MKQLVTFLGALVISSTVMAKTMECNVSMNMANAGGLMPAERMVKLQGVKVQSGHLDVNQCSLSQISNLSVTLCGIESTEAMGVYSAEILIEELGAKKEEMNVTAAYSMLGTSKAGKGLVELNSKSALSPSFTKKLMEANIQFPEYQGGDSLAIDESVATAFKKGVVTESDIVSISIDSCEIK